MSALSITDVRAAVKSLRSTQVMPDKDGNYHAYSLPRLRDGVIYFGMIAVMHPSIFLDMFGEERFLALKSDVSKTRMKKFVKKWKRTAKDRGVDV
jgi:hypothetical protein